MLICSSGAPTLNFHPKSFKVAQIGLKVAKLASRHPKVALKSSKLAQMLVPETIFPPFSVTMTLLFRPLFQVQERRVKSAQHIPIKKKGEVPPPGPSHCQNRVSLYAPVMSQAQADWWSRLHSWLQSLLMLLFPAVVSLKQQITSIPLLLLLDISVAFK